MNPHLTDEELLQSADGELSAIAAKQVDSHLAECWSCRERMRSMEETIAQFTRAHHAEVDPKLPAADGPRALLRAQLAALNDLPLNDVPPNDAPASHASKFGWMAWLTWQFAAACVAIIVVSAAAVILFDRSVQTVHASIVSVPKPSLTPGAVVMLSREEVCSAEPANNRVVPVSVRTRVLEEYGISKAEARSYEVDYLITPALGGSDDIHNLWPQSYAATMWNAHVKDALEQHLRSMVCAGEMDLATAQRELSQDWIAAYKKYFHTDEPR